MREINQTKIWFFEQIKKIEKPIASLGKKKRKTQITKIRNERMSITTNLTEMQKIIEYDEQLYAKNEIIQTKFNNFLKSCKLLKLTITPPKNLDDINRSLSKEIKLLI